MKNKLKNILPLILLLSIQIVSAQKVKEEIPAYQRSSLHNILVVGDSFDNSDVVANAYQSWQNVF